ncbi:MAG TPA: molybdopterin dinucleotide binding domain-containing protein, partial [Longimicrobiales bacterium]|nr:molybdopterin dinucleotide binding domain-containing protein [Longimicrobiales bacterium]
MYDTKPGWWIAKQLGMRMGLPNFFPWNTPEEYAESRLKPLGIDCEILKTEGVVMGPRKPIYFEEGAVPEFWTDSGKIELFSQKLAAAGFDPLPVFRADDVEEPPPGYYRLLFGRAPMHTFGRTTNNELLLETGPENAVWVNTRVAAAWGLENGERIHLKNQDDVTSNFSAPVRVTEGIRPDCVYVVHGFGHESAKLRRAHGRGLDDSQLITRVKIDPIMGGTGMNVNFVTFVRPQVVAAERAAGAAEASS